MIFGPVLLYAGKSVVTGRSTVQEVLMKVYK